MARPRRGGSSGGGFRAPKIKGTLGSLLRSATVVREVLERGAREGRARFDDARQHRRRTDALGALGEIVLDLIRRGEIDPEELPEIRAIVDHLDEIDGAGPIDEPAAPPPPKGPPRTRFDARRAAPSRDDDAAVSSRAWSPPPPKPAARVWRPVDEPPAHGENEQTRPPPFRGMPLPRKGGISFDGDDDADLADYMHPDDVPDDKDPKDDGGA